MSQDVRLAVPRLLSHRAIPDDAVLAMGYWAVLEVVDRDGTPDGFTVSRPSSRACKGRRTGQRQRVVQNTSRSKYVACTGRQQVFWHDWAYVGSQSSIARLAQVHRGHSYMVNLTTRCLGLCPEEQTVLQLQALGVHLSPLGWRNVSLQRLPGGSTPTAERPVPTAGRLVGGQRGPCSAGRAVRNPIKRDAGEDVYVGGLCESGCLRKS